VIPERLREPLLWAAGAVVLFVVFAIGTFPYGVLQARMLAEVVRATGMDVQVGDWSATIPATIEWRDVLLVASGGKSVRLDSLQARLAVISAMMGKASVDFGVQFPGSARAQQGRLHGVVKAASWSFQGPVELRAAWQQVELSSFLKEYVSQGLLQGEGVHRWDHSSSEGFKGEGTWTAEAKDVVLGAIPIGTGMFPSLSFTRVTTAVNCSQSVCDVTELKGEGPDGSFTIQGQVTVQRPIEKSTLALNVSLLPGAGLGQKLGSLGLPPLQPGVPLTLKVIGPANAARVAF
jgi:type II secretion system protein N